jgi:hypothetical protein
MANFGGNFGGAGFGGFPVGYVPGNNLFVRR